MIDHILGNASREQMQNACSPMGSHRNQISPNIVSKLKNSRFFRKGIVNLGMDLLKLESMDEFI
jgi:hypothetical protein